VPQSAEQTWMLPGAHEEHMHLWLLLQLLNCCGFCFLKCSLKKNGQTVTLLSYLYAAKAVYTFWNPRHILQEDMRLSRILATVYPFVCYSHCIPLQKQNYASFPKELKSLIFPVG